MDWTRDRKLAALIRLPWTVRTERNPDEGYLVARVEQLRSVIATGETKRELARDLWESLEASLAVYLDNDDEIPLPPGTTLPWLAQEPPTWVNWGVIKGVVRGDAWASSSASSSSLVVAL